MSDYISTADELELLSDVLISPCDSDMASIHSSSMSPCKSSSAHETSKDYDTCEQDDVYNNRAANYYYGDRSSLKKSQKTGRPLRNFVNCSGYRRKKWDHGSQSL